MGLGFIFYYVVEVIRIKLYFIVFIMFFYNIGVKVGFKFELKVRFGICLFFFLLFSIRFDINV